MLNELESDARELYDLSVFADDVELEFQEIAYIGGKSSPYDEGEYCAKALFLIGRDIRKKDLQRFHGVERIVVKNTMINEELSLSHFEDLEEVILIDVFFGATYPDLGSCHHVNVTTTIPDTEYPGGSGPFFENLFRLTSKPGMTLSIGRDFGDLPSIIEGWLGTEITLEEYSRQVARNRTIRISNCPNLESVLVSGGLAASDESFTQLIVSQLPQLQCLQTYQVYSLEIEDLMDKLTFLRFNLLQTTNGTIRGLDNCCSLEDVSLGGCDITDLTMIAGNPRIKTLSVHNCNLVSLNGIEYLNHLEHIEIGGTIYAKKIEDTLSSRVLSRHDKKERLLEILYQVDYEKVSVVSGYFFVSDFLKDWENMSE